MRTSTLQLDPCSRAARWTVILVAMFATIWFQLRRGEFPIIWMVWGLGLAAILFDLLIHRLRSKPFHRRLDPRIQLSLQAGQLLLDQAALGTGIYFLGGPHTPFLALYLPYLTASACSLPSPARYMPAGLSVLAIGGMAMLERGGGATLAKVSPNDHSLYAILLFLPLIGLSVELGASTARRLKLAEQEAEKLKRQAHYRVQDFILARSAVSDPDLLMGPEHIARAIARMALAVTSAAQAEVLLPNGDDAAWRVVAVQRRDHQSRNGAARNGTPHDDAAGVDGRQGSTRPLVSQRILEIPLVREGRPTALLKLIYEQDVEDATKESLALQLLSQHAAVAVENAIRYEKLLAEQEQIKAILDHVSDGIVVLDDTYRVVMMNPAAEAITGWEQERALDVPCTEIFRCHDERNLLLCDSEGCPLRATTESENGQPRTVIFHRQDGQHVWAEVACAQLEDLEGRPSFLCTIRDVTEFKNLERLKSEFIASVSHELRSPLTIISGYSQILERALRHDEELLYYASAIDEESQLLARLVDDLLDFSRIEAGRLRLTLEWCDLAEVILETVRTYEGHTKGHPIRVNLKARPVHAHVDPVRVRQVLMNLLNNAIKYTPEGTPIEVSLTLEEEDGKRYARISVRDEGPGIDPEHQKKIFDRFYQISPSQAGGGGVGLGLSICKAIVEGHGGRIWVESTPGKGSTFHFTLPLPSPADEPIPPDEPADE